MAGTSNITNSESIMFADNASFDGTERGGKMNADGQLWIGSTSLPHVRLGSITSPDSTLTISYASPNITIETNGSIIGGTITGNTGGAIPPTAGNWNVVTDNATVLFSGAGSTLTQDFGLTNLFLGSEGPSITSAMENVAVGFEALNNVTQGVFNVCIGYKAGREGIDASLNVFIGREAGKTTSTGTANNALGANALALNNGDNNTAIGYNAMSTATAASNNVVVGHASLAGISNGSHNTCIGPSAFNGNSLTGSDSSNILIGNAGTAGNNNKIRIGTSGSGSGQQNQCFIAGISGVSVASSLPVIIDSNGQLGTSAGGGMTWTEVTGTSQNAAVGFGYIANNVALVTITLPANFAVGDVVRVAGLGAGLWRLAANTGDIINFGSSPTSAGGSLTAINRYDAVEVLGVATNSTWNVLSVQGNLSIA